MIKAGKSEVLTEAEDARAATCGNVPTGARGSEVSAAPEKAEVSTEAVGAGLAKPE